MKDWFSQLQLNWRSMDASKRRQTIIAAIVSIVVLAMLIAALMSEDPIRKYSQPTTTPEPYIHQLGGGPQADELMESIRSNAAYERQELEKKLANLAEQAETTNRLILQSQDQSLKNHKALKQRVDNLQLEIGRERSSRIHGQEELAKALDGVHSSAGPVSRINPSQGLNSTEGFSAIPSQDMSTIGASGEVEVMSPFDMLGIASATGIQLQFGQNGLVPQVEQPAVQERSEVAQLDQRARPNPAKIQTRSTNSSEHRGATTPVSTTVEPGPAEDPLQTLITIPSGSLIQGRLVSGVVAPVIQESNGIPQPVLIKLTDPILLPNGHRVAARGCVMMASGTGNLSTERVYFQTTILSCVSDSGDIFETTVKGNGIGADSIIGLKGKVVTRDGALMARSVQAGILGGFSNAFSSASAGQIQVSTDGSLPALDYVGKTALGNGLSEGFGKMMDRLNTILDQIFPVIEIHAGRIIEIQVLQSFVLKEAGSV